MACHPPPVELFGSLTGIFWEIFTRRHRLQVERGFGSLPTGVPFVFVRVRNAGRTSVWVDGAAILYEEGHTVQIPVFPTRLEPEGPWVTFPAAGSPGEAFDLTGPAVAWVREAGGRMHHD